MIKLVLVAVILISSSAYALEPGELPGPIYNEGGVSDDKTPLPPTSSDGGFEG